MNTKKINTLKKRILKDNLIKNILLIILLLSAFPSVSNSFSQITDNGVIGSILVAVSILAVTACFGNFAFTYEPVDFSDYFSRFLAHATTGLLMLLIGLSLEITFVICNMLLGKILILNIAWITLYIASVFYDFWDLQRANYSE